MTISPGQTGASGFFAGLESFRALAAESRPARSPQAFVVYGGTATQKRTAAQVVAWSDDAVGSVETAPGEDLVVVR